jgi:21S rRNA (uridine2791-2'-O)-methyltransferase
VKRYLENPNQGRRVPSLSTPVDTADTTTDNNASNIASQVHLDNETIRKTLSVQTSKKTQDNQGKMVDVVLSDMSEPWPLETPNSWKRSLSDPYIRMMNTSGINYKDHAGSMV